MSARLYSEVNHNTIPQLKIQGYRCVQFVLLDYGNPYQATVEIVPLKYLEFGVDIVSLHSGEIDDYLEGDGGMVMYVIGVGGRRSEV